MSRENVEVGRCSYDAAQAATANRAARRRRNIGAQEAFEEVVAVDGARLKPLPLFSWLSKRQRDKVARHCHPILISQGEHLLDEGHSAYEFFVIEEGTAAVVSAGKHLRDLGPGDFLGEIGLVRG